MAFIIYKFPLLVTLFSSS